MDALELAYTPHPAFKSRMTASAAAAPSSRENATRGLAVAAVASLALIGGAALTAAPRASEAPETAASEARPFARREAAPLEAAPAPVFAAAPAPAAPAPVETRPASPLPLAGDVLGSEPDQPATMTISASPREQHVLTSFDGTRTMTNGPVIVQVASAAPQRRALARAPVVWNRPLNWISTH